MGRIKIGDNARGRPVYLKSEARRGTHTHVVGGTNTGKSKFLESLIRQDIKNRQGLCVIDWHGTLCQDVLRWCHQYDIGLDDGREIVLLNPSEPEYITGFNPFARADADVATQVSRQIDAFLRSRGEINTDAMPLLESNLRALLTFAALSGEPLLNAVQLLDFKERKGRDYAIKVCGAERAGYLWRELQDIKQQREFRDRVLSTQNRCNRFVDSAAMRRFMGLPDGNIDLGAAMDEGKIVLVNLAESDSCPLDVRKVFAALLLNAFFGATMRRAKREPPPSPFILYCDEFQEYITDDLTRMLDQVRKGGLHLVLAHQHLGHFADDPKLQKAVTTDARLRAVFGGLDYEDSCFFGNEMFLSDLNTRQIKKAYYHTTHLYREELRSSETSSWGTSESRTVGESAGDGWSAGISRPTDAVEGWFDSGDGQGSEFESESGSAVQSESISQGSFESHSTTTTPVFVPIPKRELGHEAEWSREEKLSKIAELLKCQQRQHCFVKLDQAKTQPIRVPDVTTRHVTPESLNEYVLMLYERQGARRAADVDQLLDKSREQFFERIDRRDELAAGGTGKGDDDGWH